jgi:hypothetical protein
MTTPASSSPQAGASPAYYISFDRVAELGRSAVAVLADRRAPASPSFLKQDHELTDPEELVEEIAEFGPQEEDYIRSDMPIQEIVFRMLLARRNRPTPLQELHEELTGKWSTAVRPINVTESGLARILDQDNYYGFSHAEPA